MDLTPRSAQRWVNSVFKTEYEYYSVSEICPNTNTIRVQKSGRMRIRIYECHFSPNTNTKYRISIQKQLKSNKYQNLEQWKLHVYCLFCAFKYNRKFKTFDLCWITYYSVFKLQPNTNTNTIRVWEIMQIRIRIVFGFEKSSEYEYE